MSRGSDDTAVSSAPLEANLTTIPRFPVLKSTSPLACGRRKPHFVARLHHGSCVAVLSVRIVAAAGLAYEHAHGIVLLHDEGLCAIDLDLGVGPLFLRSTGTILPSSLRARTQSNDVAPLRLLGDSVRDDGASGGVGFAVDAAQGHVIVQGRNLMVLLQCLGCRL